MSTTATSGNEDPNHVDTTGALSLEQEEAWYVDRINAFKAADEKRKAEARKKRIEGNIARAKAAKKKKKKHRKRNR